MALDPTEDIGRLMQDVIDDIRRIRARLEAISSGLATAGPTLRDIRPDHASAPASAAEASPAPTSQPLPRC